jgi:hypothetical protein
MIRVDSWNGKKRWESLLTAGVGFTLLKMKNGNQNFPDNSFSIFAGSQLD